MPGIAGPGVTRRRVGARVAIVAAIVALLGVLPSTGAGPAIVLAASSSPTLTSIAVTPANITLDVGTNPTQQFVATGTYSDATTADLTSSVTWASSDVAHATIDAATGLASGRFAGSSTISATLGAVTGSTTLTFHLGTVTIGNGGDLINGSYLNAQNIADNLVFTSIEVQADTRIVIEDDVDLSTSVYGLPLYGLFLTAPTLDFDKSMKRSASSNLYLTTDTLNLSDRITSGGTLVDPARVHSTATQVNVLSTGASVQQGIDISSTTAPVMVQVSPGQYAEDLTIDRALTLRGNDGTAVGADPTAPEIVGTLPGGNTITVTSDNVTIDGLRLNGAVGGGALTPSVNGVYANAVGDLTIRHNTLEGFSGPGISTPGSTNVTLDSNLIVGPVTLVSIAVTPANPTIATGTDRQFTATGTYSDATTADLTSAVVWSSATSSVATIGATTGLAHGVASGTSSISATLGAVSGGTILTVGQPACSKTWTTPEDGLWSDATKWTPAGVPTSSDDACITTDGSYTVTVAGAGDANHVTLGASGNDRPANPPDHRRRWPEHAHERGGLQQPRQHRLRHHDRLWQHPRDHLGGAHQRRRWQPHRQRRDRRPRDHQRPGRQPRQCHDHGRRDPVARRAARRRSTRPAARSRSTARSR